MSPLASPSTPDDSYNDEETTRRSEAALKRLLNTPPQPRVKPKAKAGESKKRGRPRSKRNEEE